MSVSLYGSGQTVIQVQSYSLTSTFSSSTAAMVDSGLTVTITPQSTNSKVLVLVNLSVGVASNGYDVGMNIVRNGTAIAQGTGGTGNITQAVGNTVNNSHGNTMNMNYLDSPATTSACTYKVQIQPQSGTIAYLNRTASLNGTSDVYAYGYISTITVMEISGS